MTRNCPYPGLILKLGAQVAGLALTLRDELLQGQGVVLPQCEANVPQQEQNQLDVLLRKRPDHEFEDVGDDEGVHHLEVVQMADEGHQVVALFAFSWVFVHLVEFPHDRLQEIGPHLQKRHKEICWFDISVMVFSSHNDEDEEEKEEVEEEEAFINFYWCFYLFK